MKIGFECRDGAMTKALELCDKAVTDAIRKTGNFLMCGANDAEDTTEKDAARGAGEGRRGGATRSGAAWYVGVSRS